MIEKISPFKFFLLETFPFIEQDYFDSINEWQMFCNIGEKINEIVKSQNGVGAEVEILNQKYEALRNYLENLDIQEEVDKKLDEMAEDGTLDRVIENFVDYCYIIDEIEKIDLYNENGKTNVTIFHIPNKDVKGNDIVLKHGFSNDIIENTPALETPTEFSKRKNATLVTNASIYTGETESPNYNKILGLIIHEGRVVTDTREYYPVPGMGWEGRYILGLKNNGLFQSYLGNSNAEDLINDGVVETFQGFIPLLIDGNNTRNSLLNTVLWGEPIYEETEDLTPIKNKMYFIIENGKYKGVYNIPFFTSGVTYYEQTNNNRYPRQIIAQNTVSKDIYILSCSGKGKNENKGLTLEESIAYLSDLGCSFAYLLDQGGSVSSAYRNINRIQPTDDDNFVTRYTDGFGVTERKVPDFIYFSKEINSEKDSSLNYIYSEINTLKKRLDDLIVNLKAENTLNMHTGNPAKIINYTAGQNPSISMGNFNHETFGNDLITSIVTTDENLSFYDNVNAKTFFRLFKNGGMSILKGSSLLKLATIFEDCETVTDINNIEKNSFVACLGSTANAPFNDENWRGNLIITLISKTLQSSEVRTQIAFMISSTPTKIANRCYSNNSWSDWKYLTLENS